MWTAARALALLQRELGVDPNHYAFQFKQPLLLPGRAAGSADHPVYCSPRVLTPYLSTARSA